MTKRNIYEVLKNYFGNIEGAIGETEDGAVYAEDAIELFDKEIAAMDKKNEGARKRAAKKRAESDALKNAIAATLTDEFKFTDEIFAEFAENEDYPELTKAKVTARLSALVRDGAAEKEYRKAEDGKKRIAYKAV